MQSVNGWEKAFSLFSSFSNRTRNRGAVLPPLLWGFLCILLLTNSIWTLIVPVRGEICVTCPFTPNASTIDADLQAFKVCFLPFCSLFFCHCLFSFLFLFFPMYRLNNGLIDLFSFTHHFHALVNDTFFFFSAIGVLFGDLSYDDWF